MQGFESRHLALLYFKDSLALFFFTELFYCGCLSLLACLDPVSRWDRFLGSISVGRKATWGKWSFAEFG